VSKAFVVESDSITRWPDDFNIRGVKAVRKAILSEFNLPQAPVERTIYRAVWNGRLEAKKIWDAYHFSLRGIARWISEGGPTEPKNNV
jgi:hypothetical protein